MLQEVTNNTINQVLDPAFKANQITKGLGVCSERLKTVKFNHCDPIYIKENACNHFRSRIFETHASVSVMLANGYKQIEKAYNYIEANKALLKADKLLKVKDIKLSMSDDDLINVAQDKAYNLEKKLKAKGYNSDVYDLLCDIVTSYQLTPPTLLDDYSDDDLKGAINRMICPLWWRRNLRALQVRVIEDLARDFRTVHKKSSPYVSDFTVFNKRNRKEKSDQILSDLFLVYEDQSPFDDFQSLKEIADSSHTSGQQQAAELMVRIRGFEELANTYGHSAEFYTLTAPSRFHSVLASGHPNKKYDGSTPREAQEYFNNIWKKARALFAKKDIRPYGFRVVEPHHDGCPHWHMLLFMQKGESAQVRKILKTLCTQDSPAEFRSSSTRFKAVHIDKSKGSAAGYIAKYITKNVDGASIKKSACPIAGEINKSPIEVAERVKAWASANNIRQFQQIGGASVTVWREMRKLGQGASAQCEIANAMNVDINEDNLKSYAIEKVRQAADSSDWAAFCVAMGGIQIKRKEQTCRIHYQVPDIIDELTGEISRAETKYGDKAVNRPVGVVWDSLVVITRKGKPHIMTKNMIEHQQKLMTNTLGWINEAYEAELLFKPSDEEIEFLDAVVMQDYQNMCLFIGYDALADNITSDEVASLDLCH